MKSKAVVISFLFIQIITFMASCNSQGSQNTEEQQLTNVDQGQNSSTSESGWYIIKMTGQEQGKISKNIESLQFFVQGVEYQSKLKGDKRKYAIKNGEIVAEVKYKEDAFKVRKPDGTLLWKIKLYEDKVKISDNEENQNPYEIKLSETTDKAKLKKNEETIGEIRYKAADKQLECTAGSKSYYIETNKLSLAYGALLIDEIPEYIRYIIIAELLAKGK